MSKLQFSSVRARHGVNVLLFTAQLRLSKIKIEKTDENKVFKVCDYREL